MMTSRISKTVTGVGLAAALAASLATPAAAASFGNIGLASSVPAQVENVRCNGCWIAGGVAAGVVAGAAIAGATRPYYGGGYYAQPYYEPAPVYAPPVVYAPPPPPRVYAPAAGYERCWIQTGPYRGQGYWQRC